MAHSNFRFHFNPAFLSHSLSFFFKMGQTDSTAQKFTRKLKMNEAFPNESSSSMESSTTTSLFPEVLTGKKDLFLNNGHLKFRKASLNSAEMPESKTVLDRSHSLPEGGLNEKSPDDQFSPSSLFTYGHMDVFHPSPSSPTIIQKQLSQLTPRLPDEASQHPHSDISELCGNESLLVYFSKVWKEDSFLVFLFLANKSPSILKDVSLEFQHSEHFKVTILAQFLLWWYWLGGDPAKPLLTRVFFPFFLLLY